MNGNRPDYRRWLALFALGLAVFNMVATGLAMFNIVAPLPDLLGTILLWVVLAIVFGLLGASKWEERRKRQAGQSA